MDFADAEESVESGGEKDSVVDLLVK